MGEPESGVAENYRSSEELENPLSGKIFSGLRRVGDQGEGILFKTSADCILIVDEKEKSNAWKINKSSQNKDTEMMGGVDGKMNLVAALNQGILIADEKEDNMSWRVSKLSHDKEMDCMIEDLDRGATLKMLGAAQFEG